MRRNRLNNWSRKLVEESKLSTNDLIWPIFITEENQITPIKSMPGINRYPLTKVIDVVAEAAELGIPAIALFPEINSDLKDEKGSEALNKNNLICKATQYIKSQVGDIGIICDVALDPYTSHGHDGLYKNGEILNDTTLEILKDQAIIQAQAGADIIAPSDMMDGRVGIIRKALDKNNFQNTKIMSYAAKYASAFYGPFRNAIGSNKTLNDSNKKNLPDGLF